MSGFAGRRRSGLCFVLVLGAERRKRVGAGDVLAFVRLLLLLPAPAFAAASRAGGFGRLCGGVGGSGGDGGGRDRLDRLGLDQFRIVIRRIGLVVSLVGVRGVRGDGDEREL